MDSLVTLNNSRSGRDKFFRVTQYALKVVNDFGAAGDGGRTLERNLASFRKLLRFGTFADTLHGIK